MMSSREIIRKLEEDGWQIVRQAGSHVQLRHPTKPGTVTVPHPRKDFHIKMIRSIERQSGVKLR
jgi:predicted RNA binding protein YcfA (HicA-like mRNA interferase family)